MTEDHGTPARDTGSRSLPSLLIADDDPVVSSTLSHQLSREFDVVGGATNAAEAIALADRHHPDVAIIDVQMPGGGGLRATHEIQSCAPQTAIVALSADESRDVVLAMLDAGAVTYIRKGMSGPELALTLHRAMDAHARLRAR